MSAHLAADLLLAVAAVLVATRLGGALAARLGQPRVMGEIAAGIALGPTLLGALAPEVREALFPAEVLPLLGGLANLGLVLYVFGLGADVDLAAVRRRGPQVAVVSVGAFVVPLALGVAAGIALHGTEFAPAVGVVGFSLFVGISLSVTALPVLAKILEERGMLTSPVGGLALACAALDDLLAWILIAVATAAVTSGGFGGVARTLGGVLVFGLVAWKVAAPALDALARRHARGGAPGAIGWVLALVLVSAWATDTVGAHLIFGAFVLGLAMPRRTALTAEVAGTLGRFVSVALLPLFFAVVGLRTDIGLLDSAERWLVAAGLLLLAVAGKLGGGALAARVTGSSWREAAVVGTLMNTRGLTELIVLTLALELGALTEALYSALVLMALVTTLMADPLLRVLRADELAPIAPPPAGPERPGARVLAGATQ